MEDVKRVSTGNVEYDRLLGGGFLHKSLNLISGCSGAGKTLFCLSYLYYGAVKYGEKGIYITLEEEAPQIINSCKSIGMDLSAVSDKVTIVDIARLRKMYSNHEELVGNASLLDIDMLLDIIRRNCKDSHRLVLDSVVPLSMKYPNVNEFRASLFRLMTVLKEMNLTTIFTTEVPTSQPDVISRFDIEDFLADSVTVLKQGTGEDISTRYIRIHKIRGSSHTKTFVEYNINKEGIHIMLPTL